MSINEVPYLDMQNVTFKEFSGNCEEYYEHGAGAFYWHDVRQSDGSNVRHCNITLPRYGWVGQEDTEHVIFWCLPIAPMTQEERS